MNLKERTDPTENEKFPNDVYFAIRSTNKFWPGTWSALTNPHQFEQNSVELTRGHEIKEKVRIQWTLGKIHLHNIFEIETSQRYS
ncbi:hypothetical protein AVEN_275113-1 [Araneus ventricosus]|uniref:Uncharacterized protein n=1 Tax=Araneus ventricosus TaxID=182803 RepID=A0A4Y2P5Z0_ARAVE|nr:hypothetical protein AVEN_275113-1 [Araneus ventricosus]